MRILYLGDETPHTTSVHRANALRRLGHNVFHVSPQIPIMRLRAVGAMGTRIGLWPVAPWVSRKVEHAIEGRSFDIAWIDGGAPLAPSLHQKLRKRGLRIINYNVDDPFGSRDGHKWDLYRRCVRHHDLTVVVRSENIAEAAGLGARKVVRVYRSFDPVEHRPGILSQADRQGWESSVSFIGTWMPERGPFLARLIELGIPLQIRGNRWDKSGEWASLSTVWRGTAVYGDDYVAATQCSRISIGLLSLGNRDKHTQRSAEIPAIGGAVFCAERTTEHQAMFSEGTEAQFFDGPEECARKCFNLLANEELRRSMASAAQVRIRQLGLSNDEVMRSILRVLEGESLSTNECWGCEIRAAAHADE